MKLAKTLFVKKMVVFAYLIQVKKMMVGQYKEIFNIFEKILKR